MNDRRCEGSERDAGVRDRYRPAEFDAERYSRENLSYWTPIMVRLGRIGQDDYVLDLGCATGGLSCAIAEATGAQLVGCDISSTLLEYARRNRGGPSTQWVRADAARLPFTHLSFDRVIASLVMHQVRDREGVLGELGRVLRPDGVLLVRTVTREAARRWIPNRFFPSVARAQAARMPPIRELTELLVRAGFSEVATETVVHRKQLELDEVERAFGRDVADRYPFLDEDEFDRGITRMRAHWAARHGDWVDARRFCFVIGAKPEARMRGAHLA
jgi:ubiquinone/menaquinone biosynthesis C-methylase UbiE